MGIMKTRVGHIDGSMHCRMYCCYTTALRADVYVSDRLSSVLYAIYFHLVYLLE